MSFSVKKKFVLVQLFVLGYVCANVAYAVFLPLPNKNVIRFTGLGIYTPEMGQTQRIGLTPDIEVHPTIKGIKEGRDELMEAAVAYIQEQNAK